MFGTVLSRHCVLVALQAVAVAMLYAVAVPVFVDLLSHLGEATDLETSSVAAILGLAAMQQACYWLRRNEGPMRWPGRNAVVSHLFRFASRTSFFFGGALFSSVFYRHLPQLEMLPPIGQTAGKVILVLLVLFSLFCFSLELDRIGLDLEKA